MNIDLLLCILGMALVTLIPRVMPVTLLAGRELPPLLTRWLSFVPVSVLAALVAPDLLLADGKLNITGDNLFLIATFPTLLICWYKKGSLFGGLAAGRGPGARTRYCPALARSTIWPGHGKTSLKNFPLPSLPHPLQRFSTGGEAAWQEPVPAQCFALRFHLSDIPIQSRPLPPLPICASREDWL